MDFRCGTYRWNSISALLFFFWAVRHCLISRAYAVFDWQVVSVLKPRRFQLSWKLVEAVVHVLLLWAGKSKINVGNSWLTAIDVSYCLFQPPFSLFFFFPYTCQYVNCIYKKTDQRSIERHSRFWLPLLVRLCPTTVILKCSCHNK